MVPKRLRLYNFMSYGQAVPELDFGRFGLACLSGPNGVGKSTLLEAITWSLWGKSRAKSDDDLIHQSQEGTAVSFEFELEGNQYRVVRKRSKKKRGQGQLEFYIFQNHDWQTLSGTSKAETQKKINETLHLDYETFVNSAFLRQNHADEFTVKRPQERKAILSEILGLSFYDELQKRAKEKIKIREIEKGGLERIIESFAHEIKNKEELKKVLKEKEKSLKEIENEVKKKEKESVVLQEKKLFLENQKNQAGNLKQRIEENKKDILSLESEIKQDKKIIKSLDAIISKREEIEKGYKTFINLKKQDEELGQKFVTRQKLHEEKNILERKILMAQKDKENELARKSSLIEDRKKGLNEKDRIEAEGRAIRVRVLALENQEKEKETWEEKIQNLKQEGIACAEKIRQTVENKREIQENLTLLLRASASCPLCEQTLTPQHRNNLKTKLKNKLQSFFVKENEENRKKQKIFAEINHLNSEVLKLKKSLQEKQKMTDLLAQKRQEYRRLLEFKKEIEKLEGEKKELEKEIGGKKIDEKLNLALKKIENKLRGVLYDEAAHQKIKKQKAESEKYQRLVIQLKESEKQKRTETKSLENKKNLLAKKKNTINADLAAEKKITFNPKMLEEISSLFETKKTQLNEARQRLMTIKEEFGRAFERVLQVDLKEKEIKSKKQRLEMIKKESSVYDDIAEALGKKGVQAMIIESVLPEIEEGANSLLAKMTEDKMTIQIFTQKEKKSDEGVQETLDIQIQDERGMRPYEMFSGGEAFRINFAIRIALSKLLARRAGAKLQFLVIDEGFGTQDALGREYIIEAINSVRPDFKKILAITHIQELKDAFPVRIEVTKDENGSHFEIMNS